MNAIDLFAGPGGWDLGAHAIPLDPLGLETDDDACDTRRHAGLRTIQADVSESWPEQFGPVDLLIASPPCQAWSAAGNRGGVDDLEEVFAASRALVEDNERPTDHEWNDPRSELVVEPLRWALALMPRYIALEQVPPVLDYWKYVGELLREVGYGVWVGILEAERYGVPQTRERAILMAEFGRSPNPPAPTHQRYVPGEAQRHEVTLEGEILPWVSMAEALGWGMTARPSVTVPAANSAGGGPRPLDGGTGAREIIAREQDAGRWEVNTGRDWKPGGSREDAQRFDAEERPAPAIDGKGRWGVKYVSGNQENHTERDPDEPAPTVTAHPLRHGVKWAEERPATTIAGDPRVFSPGGHMANDGRDNSNQIGRSDNAIRVLEREAGLLQGFPADYPWQGTRTAQFRQIGNAIPPPLAEAILTALVRPANEGRLAA